MTDSTLDPGTARTVALAATGTAVPATADPGRADATASTDAPGRAGPRQRLVDAARDLTYRQGLHVGVDAILDAAGVARRSLYQHFGGKDGLIVEVLRTADSEARYAEVMDAAGDDPRLRVLAVFDDLEQLTTQESFRGCRYTTAELTLSDPAHPAHAEIRGYKDRLHAMFTRELERSGHPSPAFGADQLLVLVDGVLAHAVTRPDAHPALAAKALAELLLTGF